jgi:hypothetical protein
MGFYMEIFEARVLRENLSFWLKNHQFWELCLVYTITSVNTSHMHKIIQIHPCLLKLLQKVWRTDRRPLLLYPPPLSRGSNRVSLGNPFYILTIKPSSVEKWSWILPLIIYLYKATCVLLFKSIHVYSSYRVNKKVWRTAAITISPTAIAGG